MSRNTAELEQSPIVTMEKETQQFWAHEQVFARSLEKTKMGDAFTFYDGPPFATGLPHYGHMLAGSIKDAVTRYQTMKGRFVERRFGWDCHGVPIEHIIEKNAKEKGIVIDRHTLAGRAEFNEQCRSAVMKYTNEWRRTQNRIGRFIDMDNDYKTMNPAFMESVWWVFKKLHEKNLVYRGKRVVAYSPGLGTPLSDFEAKEAYKTIQDPKVVVAFTLADRPDTQLLAWTTTPWTLLTNVGVAINQKNAYVKITTKDGSYILTKASVETHFSQEAIIECVDYDPAQLLGKKYLPLFNTVSPADQATAFTIVHSDHVTENKESTGIVHLSPAFGEDDFLVGQKHQMPVLDFFDVEGRFDVIPTYEAPLAQTELYEKLHGVGFKDADKLIIAFLRTNGMLFSSGTVSHDYPFCYRTDKPLMYRAISCWFVAVTKIKDRMLENNALINWYPSVIGEHRFAEWLKNARDWNISRNRYWGTPLPIWQNVADDNDLIFVGSREELRTLSGITVDDLHSHFVDPIEIQRDGKTYHRVPEVFDCWFESGAMPYAQVHYPFEHQEDFHGSRFPAHFIAEGLDQTRGWFYTLLILSTALYDRPPFLNCLVNGILLGNDGKKMSKSKGNYPSLDIVLDKYGADALRFVLLQSRATQAEPLAVKDELFRDVSKALLIPMMHLLKFFQEAVEKHEIVMEGSFSERLVVPANPLDQWLLWRTEAFKAAVTENFERFNLVNVCRAIESFVDDFSRWYVRNIKFFLNKTDSNSLMSLRCMHFALETLSVCAAPVIPFMAEHSYRHLFGMDKSVHLCDWPQPLSEAFLACIAETAAQIVQVQKIVGLGYQVRDKNGLPLSQPLSLVHLDETLRDCLESHCALICRALNVEEIAWESADDHFDRVIKLNCSVLGKKLKNELPLILSAISDNDYTLSEDQQTLRVRGIILSAASNAFTFSRAAKTAECGAVSAIDIEGQWIVLNPVVTPALKEKANVRAFEREIMKIRKLLQLSATEEMGVLLSGTLLALAMQHKTAFSEKMKKVILLTASQGEDSNGMRFPVESLNREVSLNGDILVYRKHQSTGIWSVVPRTLSEFESVKNALTL